MNNASFRARHYHDVLDPHRRISWLADVILGGQDGLVNVLGVILGVAAATGSTRMVLVAGLATACAESVSMAAVGYTSTTAEGDHFKSERAREYRHIVAVPQLERAEIREIYERKGFSGALLEQIVETITKDKDVWVAVMMAEEHRLVDVDRRSSARAAGVIGLAALVGSLLPLAPFLFFSARAGAWVAVLLGALSLFAVGAYKARATIGHPLRSGFELALIGTVSALVGYVIGAALPVATYP
ncbi:VIT1/CCC1 transporter family protein [Pendulispora brunnea]|uniref:VIT1/CCC1 transporter family protein n=1 Tax=Pendulispora brunnea TaxID=2905690 RepID=A0ABZ2K113_9BACT